MIVSGPVKLISSILMFCSIHFVLRKANLKKDIRGRQFPLLIAAPFFMIVSMIGAYFLDRFLLIPVGRMAGAERIIANTILAGGWLPVRTIILGFANRFWSSNLLMETTCQRFYEYDEDYNLWFLRDDCRNMKSMTGVLALVLSVTAGLMMGLGWIGGRGSAFYYNIYPVVAIVVVTEVFNFLSGNTREEYMDDVGGDDSASVLMGTYQKLKKVYENLLPHALLGAYTGSDFYGRKGAFDLLEKMSASDDETDRMTAHYFRHLKKKEGLYDTDLVSAANTLMHGENVVVLNPFYRDLSDYILLPVLKSLLSAKKVLLIVSRNSISRDAEHWLRDELIRYGRTRNLWRVEELNHEPPECEVGILPASGLYDLECLSVNKPFFCETTLVILLEPSRILATAQSGLKLLTEKMSVAHPVFFVSDHDTDGLVDTLSHVLETEFVHVVSAPLSRGTYTALSWDACGDFLRQRMFQQQTHFLGNGIELSGIAIKNQIPATTWISESKAPVKDIQWIAGQYYQQFCKYTHLPNQQNSLEEHLHFSANLWDLCMKQNEFLIVEDEFCNLFEMFRLYTTRGAQQSFINVISENYLLRDYMSYNHKMFVADPKAIPSITTAYANTERNITLRLILAMACAPVKEQDIHHAYELIGKDEKDVSALLQRNIAYYTGIPETVFVQSNRIETGEDLTSKNVMYYGIEKSVFESRFSKTLMNAFFVVEDETFEKEIIDARMFEHITQLVMPGQFVTYEGKHYIVKQVSPRIGCVLNRASDHYASRKYYRQIRKYHLNEENTVLSERTAGDIGITLLSGSFSVDTTGYVEMRDIFDLRTAKRMDLSEDPSIGFYSRSYQHKSFLRLTLPDTDEQTRYTISVLFNELLRTIFPDAWQYISALSVREEKDDGMLGYMNYFLDGVPDDESIYIIEDSDMDLGLLETVENSLGRLFEIIADYLDWHFEQMRALPPGEESPKPIQMPADEAVKGRNPILHFFKKLRMRLTHRNKGTIIQKKAEAAPQTAAAVPEDKTAPEKAAAPKEDESKQENPALRNDQPMESPEEESLLRSEEDDLIRDNAVQDEIDLLLPAAESVYQKRCCLKFGFDEIDASFVVESAKAYLTIRGYGGDNDLRKARKRLSFEDTFLDTEVENHCDFCMLPLSGISYDLLPDGRIRCNDCSSSAITDVADFKNVFSQTKNMMENVYDIRFKAAVSVQTADARKIAKHRGMVFAPSKGVASRVLGFAQRKGTKFTVFVENGSPRLATIATLAHEMTHIWQYLHWNDKDIVRQYGDQRNRLIVYEGMACWSEIQLLYIIGESVYARQQELLLERRSDEYGIGFRLYKDKYGIRTDGSISKVTPFHNFPPL